MKTFSGDFFAGKLDTKEWKLVLFFTFGVLLPFLFIYETDFQYLCLKYCKIFIILFVIQLICECGDNYLESWTFFRHRYSYEILNMICVLFIPFEDYEFRVIQFDMLICLCYRLSNTIILLLSTDYLATFLKVLGFKLHGLIIGIPVVNVTDPEIGMLVMKNSVDKGLALERSLIINIMIIVIIILNMINFIFVLLF